MAGTFRKGVKRKYEEEENTGAFQRRAMIDMSWRKLRENPVQRYEVHLRRSVLILNTLRRMESEMGKGDACDDLSFEAGVIKNTEMSVSQLALEPLPSISTFINSQPAPSTIPVSVSASSAGETGSEYSAPVGSCVDLLPCKYMNGCNDQTLSQSSSSSCHSSESPVADSPPPSSLVYDSAAASSQLEEEIPVLGDEVLDIIPLPPISTFCDAFVGNPFQDPTSLNEGDSNRNLSTLGPYDITGSVTFDMNNIPDIELIDNLQWLQDFTNIGSTHAVSTGSSSSNPVLNGQCSTYCRQDPTTDDLENLMKLLIEI